MPPKPQPRHTLSYQLREIIDSRGLTAYAAAKLAEVDPGVVSRWMAGRRDIRMETADKLAQALGLRLTETGRWAGRSKPARSTRPARDRPGSPMIDGPGCPPEATADHSGPLPATDPFDQPGPSLAAPGPSGV